MSEDLDDIVDNLREPSAWIRIIFMVGFALVLYLIIAPIVFVLMIVQALFAVLTGESNTNLRRFGGALGQYVTQILQFLTYNSHEKPFPFSDFPAMEEAEVEIVQAKSESKPDSDKTAGSKKSSASKKAPARKKTAAKKTARKKAPAKKSATSSDEKESGSSTANGADSDSPTDEDKSKD